MADTSFCVWGTMINSMWRKFCVRCIWILLLFLICPSYMDACIHTHFLSTYWLLIWSGFTAHNIWLFHEPHRALKLTEYPSASPVSFQNLISLSLNALSMELSVCCCCCLFFVIVCLFIVRFSPLSLYKLILNWMFYHLIQHNLGWKIP